MPRPTTPTQTTDLPLTSASQIDTYLSCARKWAWRYIAKVETPQHPSAALGTDVDDNQLQPYLRDNRPFDYTRDSGYIAASLLGYLPPAPLTGGQGVQKHFVMPSPTWVDGEHIGFGYQGYIDLWLPDSRALPDLPIPLLPAGAPPIPAVVDFKTTSDLKWALTTTTLATNVQAQLYATHAMFVTGAREVDLVWLYAQTKGPRKSKRVHLRVAADHVARQFAEIDAVARAMFDVRRAAPEGAAGATGATDYVLSLEANPDTCGSYGGCPYRDRCNLSPDQIVDSMAAKAARVQLVTTAFGASNTMSHPASAVNLLASLQAQRPVAAPPAPPAPVAPAPPPASGPPPVSATVNFTPSWFEAAASTAAAPSVPVAPPSADPHTLGNWRPLESSLRPEFRAGAAAAATAPTMLPPPPSTPAPESIGLAVGINPPEAAIVAAAAAAAPPTVMSPPPATMPSAPMQVEGTKRGPGRPKGSRNVEVAEAARPASGAAGATVTCTVGPFAATVGVLAEETVGEAAARLYGELAAVVAGLAVAR